MPRAASLHRCKVVDHVLTGSLPQVAGDSLLHRFAGNRGVLHVDARGAERGGSDKRVLFLSN